MLAEAKAKGFSAVVFTIDAFAPGSSDAVDRAGFQVSNHGGRQLDGVPASIKALPGIVKEVDEKTPIILDSGIRRGSDVFTALALGASAVALGRPVLYGLALGGAQGVASVYARLKKELARTMTIAGAASIKDISRDFLSVEENPLKIER